MLSVKPTCHIYLFVIALLWIATCTACSGIAQAEKQSYASVLINRINRYRLENRLNRLVVDPILMQLARQHSLKMFQAQQANHNGFDQRVQQAGSQLCVENVGWNYPLPEEMFEGWRQSDGHRRNMLKKGVQRVGIAEIDNYVTFFACK